MCWFCTILVFWVKGFNVGCLLIVLIPTLDCWGFGYLWVWRVLNAAGFTAGVNCVLLGVLGLLCVGLFWYLLITLVLG